MIYQQKNIYIELQNQLKKIPKIFYNQLYVSTYSSTKANEPILPDDIFIGLNTKNLANFLMRSNPILIFNDDFFKLTIGKHSGFFTLEMLQDLKAKDVYDLLSEKELGKDGNIKIEILEASTKRKAFFNNINELVREYCDKMNNMVNTISKQKSKKPFSDDCVYLIECTDHESELVSDGFDVVASGNTWDFHEGCCGLSKYKKLNLSGWEGAGSLASILSAGLKKKKIYFSVNEKEFDLFKGNGYDFVEKKPDYGEETIEQLIRSKKNNEKNQFFNKFKGKNLNISELNEVLSYQYGNNFFDIDEEENHIVVLEGKFVYDDEIDNDFQKFVNENCKGWYIDFLYTSTLCLCRLF